MNVRLRTVLLLTWLLLWPTGIQAEEQPPKIPIDVRQEVLELRELLLQVVARLDKIERRLSEREEQGQRAGDATEAVQVRHNYRPRNGYVPDAQTAITVAVAVWNPIYGADKIKKEKPHSARLSKGVWFVRGSLPREMVGGVAEIEISKDDGRILRVSHGR